MTDTPWRIEGQGLKYCRCDTGCPCESMAPPTGGDGVVAIEFDDSQRHSSLGYHAWDNNDMAQTDEEFLQSRG